MATWPVYTLYYNYKVFPTKKIHNMRFSILFPIPFPWIFRIKIRSGEVFKQNYTSEKKKKKK